MGMVRVKLKGVDIIQMYEYTQCCSGSGSGLKGKAEIYSANRKNCSGNTLGMVRVKRKDVHIVQLHHTQCCSGSGSGLKG